MHYVWMIVASKNCCTSFKFVCPKFLYKIQQSHKKDEKGQMWIKSLIVYKGIKILKKTNVSELDMIVSCNVHCIFLIV